MEARDFEHCSECKVQGPRWALLCDDCAGYLQGQIATLTRERAGRDVYITALECIRDEGKAERKVLTKERDEAQFEALESRLQATRDELGCGEFKTREVDSDEGGLEYVRRVTAMIKRHEGEAE